MSLNNRFNEDGASPDFSDDAEAKSLLAAGRKTDAIKALRVARNIGLKEAKEIVESWDQPVRRPKIFRPADEIAAVRRIYDALLSQPEEQRARILKASAILAGVGIESRSY